MTQRRYLFTRRQLLKHAAQASTGLGVAGALLAVRQTGVFDAFAQLGNQPKKHYPMFQLHDISQRAGVHSTHHKVLLDPKLDNIMPCISRRWPHH